MNALPFGAVRSVHSFLRVSHSLWELGCSLGLLWTCYFDDFPTGTPGNSAQSAASTVTRLFDLLGWRSADEGKKAARFSPTFSCLGVSFNLEPFTSGRVEVLNTSSRTAELLRAIDEATVAGSLDTRASQSLRGRLQLADGQIFGRSSRLSLKALDNHIASGSGNLSSDTCNALKTYRQILNHGRPRVLGRPSSESLYLFTDAAYDEGRCGIGGILFGSNKEPLAFFLTHSVIVRPLPWVLTLRGL